MSCTVKENDLIHSYNLNQLDSSSCLARVVEIESLSVLSRLNFNAQVDPVTSNLISPVLTLNPRIAP